MEEYLDEGHIYQLFSLDGKLLEEIETDIEIPFNLGDEQPDIPLDDSDDYVGSPIGPKRPITLIQQTQKYSFAFPSDAGYDFRYSDVIYHDDEGKMYRVPSEGRPLQLTDSVNFLYFSKPGTPTFDSFDMYVSLELDPSDGKSYEIIAEALLSRKNHHYAQSTEYNIGEDLDVLEQRGFNKVVLLFYFRILCHRLEEIKSLMINPNLPINLDRYLKRKVAMQEVFDLLEEYKAYIKDIDQEKSKSEYLQAGLTFNRRVMDVVKRFVDKK